MKRDTAAEVEQLRAATREAHEAVRALREVLRDVAQERAAIRQMLAGIEGRVKREVEDQIQAELNRQTKEAGESLSKAVDKAIKGATDKVYARFDRITAILTGTDRPEAEHIEAMARRFVAARGPIDIDEDQGSGAR